jgi:hypothetical protein
MTPVGWAQYPSQSLLRSTAQSSLRASTETTTKLSRRWQPPRVTSTTGLQLNHLVPRDAISQCNTQESLTRNGLALLASTSELEASQTKHTQGQHIPKVLNLSQARAPPLFMAPKPNRAVGVLEHIFAWLSDSNVRAPDIGWRCPIVEFQWLFQTSHWDLSTRHRGQCTTLGVAVPSQHQNTFLPLWKIWQC